MRLAAGASVVVLILVAHVAAAATFNVTVTTDSADGVCDSHCSLREAVVAANFSPDHDTVLLPEGVFELTIQGETYDSNAEIGDLDTKGAVTIQGVGPNRTVIRVRSADRAFQIESGSAIISDLTITGGRPEYEGGAIGMRHETSLNVSRVAFVGNVAGDAGGAIHGNGDVLVADCVFAANIAKSAGGAIAAGRWCRVQIYRSTFVANVGPAEGGAVFGAEGSEVDIVDSTLISNRSRSGGGVEMIHGSGVDIMSSTFTANVSTYSNGGALSMFSGPAVISRSTFVGNTARGNNATFNLNGGSIVADHCIISSHGLWRDCDIGVASGGYNLDVHGTCSFAEEGDLSNVAAGHGPLADNGGPTLTHVLLTGSPAIDAGDGVMGTDQRGVERPVGTANDIGAYEAEGTEPHIGTPLTVPVIAHVGGVGGTPWLCDGSFTNPVDEPLKIGLRYTPGGGPPVSVTRTLAPHATLMAEDMVASVFELGDGRGALEVIPPFAGPVPAALTRIYAASGTERLGQGMPALLMPRAGTFYVSGLQEDGAYRSNVGVTAGVTDVVVQINLYRGTQGHVGATFSKTVSAGSQAQWRLPTLFPGLFQAGVPMAVAVQTSAPAIVYGSLVDQLSSDAVTLIGEVGRRVWIVPVAAHNPGIDETFWRTDLLLHNPNPVAAFLRIEYLPENTDNSEGGSIDTSVTIPAYSAVTLADVLGTLFSVNNGKGSLIVVATVPIAMSSRTYTATTGGGTYGLGVPAVPPQEIIPGRRVVSGVRVGGGYRTNLGFLAGFNEGDLELELYGADGALLATGTVEVPQRSLVQRSVQDLFAIDWSSFTVGSVVVKPSIRRVLVYISVVDGSAQDPIYGVAPVVY